MPGEHFFVEVGHTDEHAGPLLHVRVSLDPAPLDEEIDELPEKIRAGLERQGRFRERQQGEREWHG